MSWNKIPYYLRGILIGLFISIIVLACFVFSPRKCIGLSEDGSTCVPSRGMDAISYNLTEMNNYFQSILLKLVIPAILICGLIGWIIGKIRKK